MRKPRDYPLDPITLHDDWEVTQIATKGHHPAAEFRKWLVNEGPGFAEHAKREVHHVWRRCIPRPDVGRTEWAWAAPFARGAFPVTLVEVV